jgi:hypothetical protein
LTSQIVQISKYLIINMLQHVLRVQSRTKLSFPSQRRVPLHSWH